MIPLAIAIGIIEDKIANDLTSKDTKASLEDVKAKLLKHKPKQYKLSIITETQDKKIKQDIVYVDEVKTEDGFLIYRSGTTTIATSIKILTSFKVEEVDTEEEYIEGTTRGLVDL